MKWLLGILHFIFRCRHKHLSRVFTIKNRTYRVCFDCGQEFDLPDPNAAPLRLGGPPNARLRRISFQHAPAFAH